MVTRVVAVTPERWGELADFFGPSGAYSGCWCTYWRRTSAEFEAGCQDGARGNRRVLRRLTANGAIPGLIGYDDGRPVGWVSVAPRPQFGRLLRSPLLKPLSADEAADESIWSVVCFWVPRAERGHGVGRALLDAAVSHADGAGAATIEGYPVDVGGKTTAASIYTGTLPMFRRAGFRLVGRRAPSAGRRVLVRRKV